MSLQLPFPWWELVVEALRLISGRQGGASIPVTQCLPIWSILSFSTFLIFVTCSGFRWAGLYLFQSGPSARWTDWLSPVAFCTGQGSRSRRSSQLPTRVL